MCVARRTCESEVKLVLVAQIRCDRVYLSREVACVTDSGGEKCGSDRHADDSKQWFHISPQYGKVKNRRRSVG